METKDCEEIFLDPFDPKDFDALKFSPIDSTFLSMSDVVPTLLSNTRALFPLPKLDTDHTFQYPECLKLFKCKLYLTTHLKSHSEERPHVCEICQKSFKLKCHLNEHAKTQEDRKKFVCPECGLAFAKSNTLARY